MNGDWTGTKLVELRLAVDGAFATNASVLNWQDTIVSSSLLLLTQAGTLLGVAGVNIKQDHTGTPFLTGTAANGATVTTNAVNTVFDPNNVQFTMSFLFPATTFNRTFSFLGRLSLRRLTAAGVRLAQSSKELSILAIPDYFHSLCRTM